MSETVQSAFESGVETYREAMDALHDTAIDEYDAAIDEYDAAVVSLGENAAGQSSSGARDSTPTSCPAAGD